MKRFLSTGKKRPHDKPRSAVGPNGTCIIIPFAIWQCAALIPVITSTYYILKEWLESNDMKHGWFYQSCVNIDINSLRSRLMSRRDFHISDRSRSTADHISNQASWDRCTGSIWQQCIVQIQQVPWILMRIIPRPPRRNMSYNNNYRYCGRSYRYVISALKDLDRDAGGSMCGRFQSMLVVWPIRTALPFWALTITWN